MKKSQALAIARSSCYIIGKRTVVSPWDDTKPGGACTETRRLNWFEARRSLTDRRAAVALVALGFDDVDYKIERARYKGETTLTGIVSFVIADEKGV
jgi:hypothetical protein